MQKQHEWADLSLLELFCDVDDFCQDLPPFTVQQLNHALPQQAGCRQKIRQRAICLHISEIMTILIYFHQSGYRNFKTYYREQIRSVLRTAFPKAPSYSRFVELQPRALLHLAAYLYHSFGTCTGISFVDSTKIEACHISHIKRKDSHRVFKENAALGKTSMGWFYGFKLHLICNDRGELLWVSLTTGNTDDRKELRNIFEHSLFSLFGHLFGDRGYISKDLFADLINHHDVALHTRLKKNMKCSQPIKLEHDLFLRKRALIESIIDQLKNISQIEHSRHRSPLNFFGNLICGLIAYCRQPKKPSLRQEMMPLPIVA